MLSSPSNVNQRSAPHLTSPTFLGFDVEVGMIRERDFEARVVVLNEVEIDGGEQTFVLVHNFAGFHVDEKAELLLRRFVSFKTVFRVNFIVLTDLFHPEDMKREEAHCGLKLCGIDAFIS